MQNTFIIHGSWLLPEIRTRCNRFPTTDEIEPIGRTRSTVVANKPPENTGTWIWIKGFHASRRAWLEHNDFLLPTRNSSLSWRIDPSVLPTIYLNVNEQENSQLIVQIFAYPKSKLRRARRLVEDFYSYELPGTPFILAGLQRILRTARNVRSLPLFSRKKLAKWTFQQGEHFLNLSELVVPPNRDVGIHVKNGGRNTLLGTMDFKVELNSGGTSGTESPIGVASSSPGN